MAEGDLSAGMTELLGRADQRCTRPRPGATESSGSSSRRAARSRSEVAYSVTLRVPSSPPGGLRGIENSKSV